MGMLYQWGRKDPFPARFQGWVNNATEPTLYDAAGVGSNTVIQKSLVTATNNLENSIANPTTFYLASNAAPPYDWYTTSEAGTNNSLWNNVKTVYDPCPPGWKVPLYTVFDDFHVGIAPAATYKNTLAEGYQSAFVELGSAISGDMGGAGCYYSKDKRTTIPTSYPVFIPAAGIRFYGTGAFGNIGSRCFVWSCNALPPYSARYFFADNTFPYYNTLNSSRAVGASVRCVQI